MKTFACPALTEIWCEDLVRAERGMSKGQLGILKYNICVNSTLLSLLQYL